MADKSFEELKEELKAKLENGFVLDEDKMADLEEALKANGNDISKIDVSKYSKKEQEAPKGDKDKNNEGTVISDHDNPGDENTHDPKETEVPADENWKEDYKNAWRQWATDNNKEFDDTVIAGSSNDVCIRLYDNPEKKKSGDYAAEVSYKGPHNVTLKGNNGKTPDSQYFEQTVKLAMEKNGPDIEFGNIQSPEFKAKLLAACYVNGANPTGNIPTEQEMAEWPKELQDMVNEAKTKASEREGTPEKTAEEDKTPKPEEKTPASYTKAWSDVLDHKMDKPDEELDLASFTDVKDKVTYFAAAQMAGIKIKNAPTAEELTTVTDPKIQEVLNDAKELNTIREKIAEHKAQSPDEAMDVSMFSKKVQTLYNTAALENGVKTSTTLDNSDLFKQPQHLQSALRRQQNEAKAAEIRKRKAGEKGVDEKTFEQNRNADRKQRIQDYIMSQQNTH